MRKREPSRRRSGKTVARARKAQRRTLTADELRELSTELLHTVDPWRATTEPLAPLITRALQERKKHIEGGDLFSLSEALRWLNRRTGQGLSYEDLSDRTLPAWEVAEVPRWILWQLQLLLARGLSGRWPRAKRGGRHAIPSQKLRAERMDYIRAQFVLVEREAGTGWEDVFERVGKGPFFKGRVSADSVRRSYLKVLRNTKADPHYYRRIWAATTPPLRS